ncbi:hypothetical protein RUND412_005270 [Rhizina undulata]
MSSNNTGTTVGFDEDNLKGFKAFLGQLDWDHVEKELETFQQSLGRGTDHTPTSTSSISNHNLSRYSDPKAYGNHPISVDPNTINYRFLGNAYGSNPTSANSLASATKPSKSSPASSSTNSKLKPITNTKAPEKDITAERARRNSKNLNNRRKRTRSNSTDSADSYVSNGYGIDWDQFFKRLSRNLNPEDYTAAPRTKGLTVGEIDEDLALMRSSWKEHDN